MDVNEDLISRKGKIVITRELIEALDCAIEMINRSPEMIERKRLNAK